MACEIKVVTENDLGNGLEIENQKVVVKLGENLSFALDGSIDVDLPPTTVTNAVVGTTLTTTVNGVEGSVDLTNAVKAAETKTVLSDVLSAGNKIGTYTNEDGTAVEIKETITSLNVAGSVLTFTDEKGVANEVDITNAVKAAETTTTLTGVRATGNIIGTYTNEDGVSVNIRQSITSIRIQDQTLEFTNENGTLNTVDLLPAIKSGETTTSLSSVLASGNKIGTYTNEDGVAVDIKETITGIAAFSFNAATSEITLTYTKEDGTPDTKVVNLSTLKLDSIASITVSPDGTKLVITNATGSTDEVLLSDVFDSINHTLSSTANVITSVVGNITETADIINSLAVALVSGTQIKLTINGVDSAPFDMASVIAAGEVDTLQAVTDRGNVTTNKVIIQNSLQQGASSCSATGDNSHAEGVNTNASATGAHAEGASTKASGAFAHSEGDRTEATGVVAHSEGTLTVASGLGAHAEGNSSIASGQTAHAEGYTTTASGLSSHSEGYFSEAVGNYSHAAGGDGATNGGKATASASGSYAGGGGTISNGNLQHVVGKFNESLTQKGAFVVGSGNSDTERNNLIEAYDNLVKLKNNSAEFSTLIFNIKSLPTSATGLSSGDVWVNGTVLNIIP